MIMKEVVIIAIHIKKSECSFRQEFKRGKNDSNDLKLYKKFLVVSFE